MMPAIAVIGAGPSGCFTAQALLKTLPDAQIDLLDHLPVPYGLVRYGVAPDHQGTKAVIRQFERVFERPNVRFFGNVTVGRDITLEALRSAYDAVVLATGLAGDRRLGVAGEDLPGILGSGRVTRALNDHPDAQALAGTIGQEVVIIGNGNVAIDLARLLVKHPDEFHGSDLSAGNGAALAAAGGRKVTVLGRSEAESAKFDPVILRELGRLADTRIEVIGVHGTGQGITERGIPGKGIEALAAIDGHHPAGARHELRFRFGWTPLRFNGEGRVQSAHFTASDGSGAVLDVPCDTVLTAIGFEADAADASHGLALQAGADGFVAPGLYATGWIRRGPRGTIPENRADAAMVAARIAADLAGVVTPRSGRAVLSAHCPQAVDYAGWQRIDAAERRDCPPDRCRIKLKNRSDMLEISHKIGGAP